MAPSTLPITGEHAFLRQVYQVLRYPRARLQYELAQQPRLLRYLPGATFDLLTTALNSHRYALEISRENPDLLLYVSLRLLACSLGPAA